MSVYIKNGLNSINSRMVDYGSHQGTVSLGIRSANDAILGSLKNGLNTCLRHISARFNKSLQAQGLEGKCARTAKSVLMTTSPAAQVVVTNLSKLKETVTVSEGLKCSLGVAWIVTQQFFLKNLVPLIIGNKGVDNDDPLTPLGFIAITISGGAVTFAAIKIFEEAIKITFAGDDFSKKITSVSSAMLTSSALVTVAESMLSLAIGSKAANISPLLSICSLPLSSGCLANVVSATAGLTLHLFTSSLTYALHESVPLYLRLALIGAYAAYNSELYRGLRYYCPPMMPIEPMTQIASVLMAGEALYPGYIGPSTACMLSFPAFEVIDQLRSSFPKVTAIYGEKNRQVKMEVMEALVGAHLPKYLAGIVMDHVDEVHFSRVRFHEVEQVEKRVVSTSAYLIPGVQSLDVSDEESIYSDSSDSASSSNASNENSLRGWETTSSEGSST